MRTNKKQFSNSCFDPWTLSCLLVNRLIVPADFCAQAMFGGRSQGSMTVSPVDTKRMGLKDGGGFREVQAHERLGQNS